MNQKNAKNSGEERGKRFLRHNPDASKEVYASHGRTIAQMETLWIETQELFIEGWNSMWKELEQPKVIQHDPNLRFFCSCPKCME